MYEMSFKEQMLQAKAVAAQSGLSMSLARNILREMDDLSVSMEAASEINAERMMSAHCSGYNAYDAELIPTRHLDRRWRSLFARISPKQELQPAQVVDFNTQLSESDLPF